MKIILLALVTFISCSSNDCKKLKTGKFEFHSKYVGKILFERDKNFQTETVVDSGTVARYKIKWLDDCSFIMFERKLLKGKELIPDPKFVEAINRDTILVEITEVNGNEYQTRSKIFNSNEDWYLSKSKKIE